MTSHLPVASTLLLLSLAACGPKAPPFVPPPPPLVTVELPVARDLPVRIEASGSLRAVETVQLRPRVQGFILARPVEGGRRVARNDLLFRIDPRPFELLLQQRRAELKSAEAQLRLDEATLGRTQAAVAQDAAAKTQLDRAEADRAASAARVELQQAMVQSAELDLDYTYVRAPKDGRLSALVAQPGQLVDPTTVLATFVDDARVYATVHLTERQLAQLLAVKSGLWPDGDQGLGLPVALAVGAATEFVFHGNLDRRDNAVDPETGTIAVEAVFANQDGALLPGMFARVRLDLGQRRLLTVPDVAVGSDPQGRFVLVVGGDGTVERRSVTWAGSVDDFAGIERGLQGDEQVVVNGTQRARPGTVVEPQLQAKPR